MQNFIKNTSSQIELEWGRLKPSTSQSTSPTRIFPQINSEVEPGTRKKVVKLVYPRVLYAFSNVVCFITSNARYGLEVHGLTDKLTLDLEQLKNS